MKTLSLVQPWASLIFAPAPWTKMWETRGWYTAYRGELAIHASGRASFEREGAAYLCQHHPFHMALQRLGIPVVTETGWVDVAMLPFGAIVGVADLVDCIGTSSTKGQRLIEKLPSIEQAFGDLSEGRFMWQLENPRRLGQPVPCRGALNVWDVPADVAAQVAGQLKEVMRG